MYFKILEKIEHQSYFFIDSASNTNCVGENLICGIELEEHINNNKVLKNTNKIVSARKKFENENVRIYKTVYKI